MNYAIEITNLSKKFNHTKSLSDIFPHPFKRTKVTLAVNGISLQIKEGESFGLVGPNGAGKTTLIKMLCCLILPTSGTAYINGYDVLREEEKVKASIGLVNGDERSFYWRLSGKQNLEFFASLYNLSHHQAKPKIEELMCLLDITEPDKRFQEYSTGIKQRLSIARSLLNDPKVLFMDEPTKSLDPLAAQSLRSFIKNYLVCNQRKTVFFVTQNMTEVEALSDRLAIMDKGSIRAIGTFEGLRNKVGKPQATKEEIFNFYINVSYQD